MDRIRAHELALTNYALARLDEKLGSDVPRLRARRPATTGAACSPSPTATCTRTTWPRCSTSSASACGPGHHCAKPLMRKLGVQATARASLSLFSDEHDIEVLIEGLVEAGRLFG